MTISANSPPNPIDFEIIPDQENEWRDKIAKITVELQEKRKSLQDGEVLRGVHPKSHGCVDAKFIVNSDLASELQVGLFAKPGRCFKAKIRFSNADVLKRPDLEKKLDDDGNKIKVNGSRGMAIKVLDVDGPVLLEDGENQNQDFLMVNTSEFAFRNVRDYRRLSMALAASDDGATPNLFFLPLELLKRGMLDMSGKLIPATGTEPPEIAGMRHLFATSNLFEGFTADDMAGTLSAIKIVEKINGKAETVRDPFEAQYFSAAPFRFGPDRVMKFSVAPLGGKDPSLPFSAAELDAISDDYLSQALKKAVSQGESITLSFMVQIANASDIESNQLEMIENASVAWDGDKFRPTEVAQLVVQPVAPDQQLVDACKPLLFTPWHALVAHEPLGGINRLRKPVYSGSADFRRSSYAAP